MGCIPKIKKRKENKERNCSVVWCYGSGHFYRITVTIAAIVAVILIPLPYLGTVDDLTIRST